MMRLIIFLAFILSACAPAATPIVERVEITREVEVTRLSEVTREVLITELAEVTRIVERVVTATYTPSPLFTPTETLTPSQTPTPTRTATATQTPNVARTATAQAFARLTRPVGDGFYLVNVDIAPGVWRSAAGSDNCYWARTDREGDILGNHFGLSGGTVNIRATDFQVEFKSCGRWEYIGQ